MVFSGLYIWRESQRLPILEIYVISLKSSQALFVRTPNDERVLINGGPNSEIVKHISNILPFYSRRIDKIILTKTNDANVTGLMDVIDRYKIGELIVPAITLQTLGLESSSSDAHNVYDLLIGSARSRAIPLRKFQANDKMILDSDKPDSTNKLSSVTFNFIFPVPAQDFKYSKASGPELVFEISYGTTTPIRILNIGGITTKIQKFLATSSFSEIPFGIDQDVLITSKNYSTTSLATKFLDKINPHAIIYSELISKSINSPKNADSKKEIYNVRESGIIKISSDGKTLRIEPNF